MNNLMKEWMNTIDNMKSFDKLEIKKMVGKAYIRGILDAKKEYPQEPKR